MISLSISSILSDNSDKTYTELIKSLNSILINISDLKNEKQVIEYLNLVYDTIQRYNLNVKT